MKPRIIAHRGASYAAPENTLASVKLAWQVDADGVEVDIQLTRDNQVVVFHDGDTRRYGGSRKQVSEQLYSDLLKLDVGRFKGEQFTGEKIPLLAEVLNTLPENKEIVIEIKSGLEIILPLQSIIRESKIKLHQVVFISFRRDSIIEIKKALPECKALRIYQLVQLPFIKMIIPPIKKMISEVQSDNLDGLDISFVPAITQSKTKSITDLGLMLYFWTIDQPKVADFLIKSGVNGITTNKPDVMKNLVDSH